MFIGILVLAGIVAGIFASVAGMASIVAYPVLIFLGYPPIMANILSTGSLVFSGVGSIFSSYSLIRKNFKIAITIIISALGGGVLGSYLLLYLPKDNFEHLVPYFILLSAMLLFISGRMPSKIATNNNVKINYPLLLLVGFLIGIYIGYFGSGAGLMLVSILLMILNLPFVEVNAIKNISTLATNILSFIIYQSSVAIDWRTVVFLGLGMFIGGYLGPKLILYFPDRKLKIFIAVCALLLAIYLFLNN
ncbi:sulfite exporter TauE/SafE family protein [Weissella coleopterorum]|uniref:Probable membrane transporter protein n=1 Tax=Weissella coleopterorum TaxID=2714949 RepID=A0A6G8B1P7_9LACO|nr:sulfite exporter TauE/SafE family protein [Weissella coleopterorum]QIL51176.1 sulfite exporter TauE/SafE family protein [Weissella coleopterorum]